MGERLTAINQVLIAISVASGAIALALACVGIGTANWQNNQANTTNGQTYIMSTANFFYVCNFNSNGEVINCEYGSTNSNIQQYYSINIQGNQSDWNMHLDAAAGLSIIAIFLSSLVQ